MGIFDMFKKKKKESSESDSNDEAEFVTVKIKPSLYYTYNKNSKPKENDYIEKKMSFYYVIATKELLIEGLYRNKGKSYYYPLMKCDPHAVDEIFEISTDLFQKMDLVDIEQTCEKLNIIEYFGVKIFGGACRKFEIFTFEFGRRWNQEKEDYCFCRGERNVDGYSFYVDYIIGDSLSKDEFLKGYHKELVKIERRLARKEQKRLQKIAEKDNSTPK